MDTEDWIKLQTQKYAGSNFGESTISVNLNLVAYQILQQYAKPGLTFLETGCNDGRVCHEMYKLGLFELGVDLPQVIEKIVFPIHKLALNLENRFPIGLWDIIYCREVYEHIQNNEEFMQNIFEHLSPSGILIITYPHSEQDGPQNCPQHKKIYSQKEMEDVIKKYGGKIIEIKKETLCRSTVLVCCHS